MYRAAGWSNYNPRNVGAQGFLGRRAPTYCANYSTSTTYDTCTPGPGAARSATQADPPLPPECRDKCDWDTIASSVEQLTLCAVALALVSVARILLQLVLAHCFHVEDLTSLAFPMWEGPVFLTQFMALTEALLGLLATGCVWIVVVSAVLVCLGPVAFIVYAGYALHARKQDGSLQYERSPWPSSADLRARWSSAKCVGKYWALQDYWSELKKRGGWGDDSRPGRHWSPPRLPWQHQSPHPLPPMLLRVSGQRSRVPDERER